MRRPNGIPAPISGTAIAWSGAPDGSGRGSREAAVMARRSAVQGGRQAGASLRTEYEQGRKRFAAGRRRAVWLSALWWGPAAVVLGLLGGLGTRYGLFGLLVFVLAVAAVIDVGFRRPRSLERIKDRAAAEAGTAKALHLYQIRGGGRILHDRVLAGAEAGPFDVEHLVISPRGVYLIDSKQWHGFDVRLLGMTLFVNHVDQAEAFAELKAHAAAIGEALGSAAAADEEVGVVSVTPVLAVHADNLTGTPRVMDGVIVMRPEQLADVLRTADLRWSRPAAEHMAEAAEYLLPPR